MLSIDDLLPFLDQRAPIVHWWFLSAEVLATIAVAAGIIFESDEYPKECHKVATRLVLWGVAIETLASVGLFTYDEHITHQQQLVINAQQSKIIALETISQAQQLKIISLDKETAIAESEAGIANERAASLEKEAAKLSADAETAKTETAKANSATEDLRNKNVELERAFSPILYNQQRSIKAVREFAQEIDVVIEAVPDDLEARRTAAQIAFIVDHGGRTRLEQNLPSPDLSWDGVFIEWGNDPAQPLHGVAFAAAWLLRDELQKSGLQAVIIAPTGRSFLPKYGVRILVGSKPIDSSLYKDDPKDRLDGEYVKYDNMVSYGHSFK